MRRAAADKRGGEGVVAGEGGGGMGGRQALEWLLRRMGWVGGVEWGVGGVARPSSG